MATGELTIEGIRPPILLIVSTPAGTMNLVSPRVENAPLAPVVVENKGPEKRKNVDQDATVRKRGKATVSDLDGPAKSLNCPSVSGEKSSDTLPEKNPEPPSQAEPISFLADPSVSSSNSLPLPEGIKPSSSYSFFYFSTFLFFYFFQFIHCPLK